MKKITVFIAIFLFTINIFAQSPEEVVKKCVSALGGEEAVKKFSDYKAKGEIKISMRGMEIPGKIESIIMGKKKWLRAEIVFGKDVFTILQAYDGKTAWMDRFGSIVDQPSLNYESDLDHDVSLLIEREASFSFAKEKEVDGRKAFGIEVDFKGKKTTFFIDKETYTIIEMVYKDLYFGEKYTKEMIEKKIKYENYRKIDNVLFPTKMTVYQEGKKQFEFSLSEVSFNPQVALAKFARPDQKLDLRYSEELIN
ncbi:MAG: hypothetical protein ACETWK_08805 [Candidatus Aminicenantaceae bacterium]